MIVRNSAKIFGHVPDNANPCPEYDQGKKILCGIVPVLSRVVPVLSGIVPTLSGIVPALSGIENLNFEAKPPPLYPQTSLIE